MNNTEDNIFALTLIHLIMDKYIEEKSLTSSQCLIEINRALKNYSSIKQKDYKK